MKPARNIILFIVASVVFAATIFLVLEKRIAAFLTRTEKVEADILIVEGWLSYNDLIVAAEEFNKGKYRYIFTTGLRATPAFYNVNTDGYLVFYPPENRNEEPVTRISVRASSELGGDNAAHFNLWVNDSLVRDFTATRRRKNYTIGWNGSPVDSAMVEFDNDKMGDFGDRNLYVKEMILNGKIRIPFLNNSIYDIQELDNWNRIANNMDSNAGLTAKRLISLGIDTSSVVVVAGRNSPVNRTLKSALAVRDFIRTSRLQVKGINIVSAGTHSRRTWMTFDRIIDSNVPVGIIALDKRSFMGTRKIMREALAYIYYSIILLPY